MLEMKQHTLSSQILTFSTLQEFMEFTDENIQLHKSELTRYEDELGQMLREVGQDNTNAEWAKQMQAKLSPQAKQAKTDGKKDEKKDKGKEKKEMKEMKEKRKDEKGKNVSANWKSYNDLHIFAGITHQGKTEVYFEAINELKARLEKLDKIKEALVQLKSVGLSSVLYLVYVKNSVPEKLVLLPQEKQEEGKFEFKADFVTENIEMPIESGEV